MRAAAVAGVTAICAAILRRHVPELAPVLSLAAAALMLLLTSGALERVMDFAAELAAAAGLTREVTGPMWKTVGIALITRLSAQFCRDAGENAVAACCETAGTFAALVAALPLMERVFSVVSQML